MIASHFTIIVTLIGVSVITIVVVMIMVLFSCINVGFNAVLFRGLGTISSA